MTMTFKERCTVAVECLPNAPYRTMLANLLDEMLAALAQPAAQPTEPMTPEPMTPEQVRDGIADWIDVNIQHKEFWTPEVVELIRSIEINGNPIKQSAAESHGCHGGDDSTLPAAQPAVPRAFEYQHPMTGHAILSYDDNADLRLLIADKGYVKEPLYTSQPAAQPTYGSPELEQLILDRLAQKAQPAAQPADVPETKLGDMRTLELAESAGLIGPESRTHDLHGAIQRFHDLIAAEASIKAAQVFAQTLQQEPAGEPLFWYDEEGGELYPPTDQYRPDECIALYTRPAVPLRDEFLISLWSGSDSPRPVLGKNKVLAFARAIETEHKIGGAE
jgi:hypothetical protein